MNNFELLVKALESLNTELEKNNISIEITIVGSMAIYLNDFSIERFTEDIDYIDYNPNDIFQKAILKVAKDKDLKDDWINSRADTIIPRPYSLKQNTIKDNRFSHITMNIIKKNIIVQMKVYAFYMRGLEKDIEDLETIRPTIEELNQGKKYIEDSIIHHHGKEELANQQKEIDQFMEKLYENFA